MVALQQQLNADILSDYKKKPLANLNAYACWLLGFNELKKGTLEADEKARQYFQQAIDIDPQYSKAYTVRKGSIRTAHFSSVLLI